MRVILAGRGNGDWASSSLTADGFPCEVAIGGGAAIRMTSEPPASSPAERLGVCRRRLAALGVPDLPDELTYRLDLLQRGDKALEYGAWIGSRHDRSSARYKIYVEVAGRSPAASRLVADWLGHSGPHRRHPLRMVGCDLVSRTTELYFRVDGPPPPDLPLRPSRADALLANGPPSPTTGFSLAVDHRLRLVAASVFVFADDVMRGEGIVSFAKTHGFSLAGYSALTDPATVAGPVAHGMLAMIAAAGKPDELRVGLAPPATDRSHQYQ